jgi:hypothetical protein
VAAFGVSGHTLLIRFILLVRGGDQRSVGVHLADSVGTVGVARAKLFYSVDLKVFVVDLAEDSVLVLFSITKDRCELGVDAANLELRRLLS